MSFHNQDRQHAMEQREAQELRTEAEAERIERFEPVNVGPFAEIKCRRDEIISEAYGMNPTPEGEIDNKAQMVGYLAQWVEGLEWELKNRKAG